MRISLTWPPSEYAALAATALQGAMGKEVDFRLPGDKVVKALVVQVESAGDHQVVTFEFPADAFPEGVFG